MNDIEPRGMNYYALSTATGVKVHIGKSSPGWAFALRVHPAMGLMTFEAWLRELGDCQIEIRDENGAAVLKDEFEKIVRDRPVRQRLPVDGMFCLTHGDTWDCCLGDFS